MAVSLTSTTPEFFYGLFSVVSFLCFGTVRSAPLSTVVLSTFDPTTITEAGGLQVPCGLTSTSTSTASFTFQTDYAILSLYTNSLVEKCSKTFKEYEEERFGIALSELMEVPLPDITSLSTPDLCEADRLATHYFILDGFKKAMVAVIKDEEQHNGSRNFREDFKSMSRLLGKVLQGTRDLVCSNGLRASGESRVEEAQEFTFQTISSEIKRSLRDYTVLHRLNEYVKQLNLDIRGSLGPTGAPTAVSGCARTTV
ncbi:uncharacterized protein LOC119720726 [Patiria miniata]|uniref:Uncharacterized protein n=1 Tax=Patiria miniata TaxID=46514 RepID=A0A913Z634_PATMI|nr:uncharacterized protein LOC119720726 [Patiria miniata]